MSTGTTTVAAIQMRTVPRDVAGNLGRAQRFLEDASARGAKLTVFPELFNVGYFIGPELFDLAEADDGRTVTWMREQAARRDLPVAGSIAERRGERLRNTLLVAEPDGRLHRYAKRQLAKPEWAVFDHGDDPSIVSTSVGRAGLAVCADLSWGRTLLRPFAGNVDLLIVPMASSKPKALLNRIWQRERTRGPSIAGTVKAIGAPMLLAGLVGPVQRMSRLFDTYLRGGTWIIDASGRGLASVPFGEEGLAFADVHIGSTGGDPNANLFRDPGLRRDLMDALVVDFPNLRPPRTPR